MIRTVNIPVTFTIDSDYPLMYLLDNMTGAELDEVMTQTFILACRRERVNEKINKGHTFVYAEV